MRPIDQASLDALREAVAKAGSQNSLALKAGVSAQNINRYLSGEIKRISDETWHKLLPHLRPYLPAEYAVCQVPSASFGLMPGCPECPLQDCPAKGIPHEPLTSALLDDWTRMTKMERLAALTAISEIRAKIAAAGGRR